MMSSAGRTRTAFLVNLATIVERADEQVLPAVYKAIGLSLNASLSQLGGMTTCRALIQTLSSPLSGILGDRFDRTKVIAAGCFIWGMMTSLIGVATSLHEAMIYCAVNGLGLALVIPSSQSLIADYYSADSRGQAFGVMAFTGAVGGLLGGFFATNISQARPLGMEGWRLAFQTVAAISILAGLLVLKFAVDPRPPANRPAHLKAKDADVESMLSLLDQPSDSAADATEPQAAWKTEYASMHTRHSFDALDDTVLFCSAHEANSKLHGPSRAAKSSQQQHSSTTKHPAKQNMPYAASAASVWRETWQHCVKIVADVRWMMGLKTFQIIVVQGIMGCFPWQAMVFFTLWLQLQGFNDFAASSLMAVFAAGGALGGWLGGVLGDRMAAWKPDRGRIMTAQISVLSGLPLTWLLLKGLPNSPYMHSAGAYGVVMFTLGLTCTWCGSGCNSPIFAEIVPPELRSTVYAFDRSFENAIASCAAPVVGLLAERTFKFQGTLASQKAADPSSSRANAHALASSLALCMLVPWSLCFMCYTGLYFVYPRERRRLGTTAAAKRVADVKAAFH